MRLFLLLLILSNTLQSCNFSLEKESILDTILKEKILLVGTIDDFPPFSYKKKMALMQVLILIELML